MIKHRVALLVGIVFGVLIMVGMAATQLAHATVEATASSDWVQLSSPITTTLYAVDGAATNDAWIAGEKGVMLRYNGGISLTQYSLPVTATFLSLTAPLTNSAWVVGFNNSSFTPIMYQWDGNNWNIFTHPASTMLSSVSSPDGINVWVTSATAICSPTCEGDLASSIYWWNGSSWNITPVEHTWLNSIFMLTPTEGWAAGREYITTTQTYKSTILKWNGLQWQSVTHPNVNNLIAVTALNSTNAFAVGNGTALYGNNTSWNQETYSGAPSVLNGVASASFLNTWAVGTSGKIGRRGGNTWTNVTSPVTTTLNAISFIQDGFGLVVGNNGVILKYDHPVSNIYLPFLQK